MPVNMGEVPTIEPGWGCSCRGFRWDQPTPEQALAALARSANVTVTEIAPHQFEAWTDPQDRYRVVFDPESRARGWCKHCIACMVQFAPWHRQLALGASDALDRIHELEKENRKLKRLMSRMEDIRHE